MQAESPWNHLIWPLNSGVVNDQFQLHDKINELQTGKILKRDEFTNSIYVHLHLFQQRHICKVIQVSK